MKIEIVKKALRIDSLSRLTVIEKRHKFIEEGKDQFVQLNDSNAEYLIRLFFNGSNISSPFLFKWKATKDETKIEIACDYLWAIGCTDVYRSTLSDDSFKEGDRIMIISWIEDEEYDHPSYFTKAIKYEKALKIIDDQGAGSFQKSIN